MTSVRVLELREACLRPLLCNVATRTRASAESDGVRSSLPITLLTQRAMRRMDSWYSLVAFSCEQQVLRLGSILVYKNGIMTMQGKHGFWCYCQQQNILSLKADAHRQGREGQADKIRTVCHLKMVYGD